MGKRRVMMVWSMGKEGRGAMMSPVRRRPEVVVWRARMVPVMGRTVVAGVWRPVMAGGQVRRMVGSVMMAVAVGRGPPGRWGRVHNACRRVVVRDRQRR